MFTDGLVERRGTNFDIGLTHLMVLAEQTRASGSAGEACTRILAEMLAAAHDDETSARSSRTSSRRVTPSRGRWASTRSVVAADTIVCSSRLTPCAWRSQPSTGSSASSRNAAGGCPRWRRPRFLLSLSWSPRLGRRRLLAAPAPRRRGRASAWQGSCVAPCSSGTRRPSRTPPSSSSTSRRRGSRSPPRRSGRSARFAWRGSRRPRASRRSCSPTRRRR